MPTNNSNAAVDSIRSSAVNWAKSIAADDSHSFISGDSIADAWGPNYKSATFVASAFRQAGVFDDNFTKGDGWISGAAHFAPLLNNRSDFTNVSTKVGLSSCDALTEGDILINSSMTHTAIYAGDCKIVEALADENGNKSNDIHLTNYYNAPWAYVYRYVGDTSPEDDKIPAPLPRPPAPAPEFESRPQYEPLNPSVASVIRNDLTCKESDLTDLEKKYCSMTIVGDESTLLGTVGNVISTVYTWVGIIAVIMIIIGGILYSTSTGNPQKVKRAKDTIFYALIGLIVALAAFAITNFVLRSL